MYLFCFAKFQWYKYVSVCKHIHSYGRINILHRCFFFKSSVFELAILNIDSKQYER